MANRLSCKNLCSRYCFDFHYGFYQYLVGRCSLYLLVMLLALNSIPFKSYAGEPMTYWIDVRTQEEFNAGHIKGSVLIPYEVIADHIAEVTQDKDAKIHVYCRSGRRSEIAMNTLKGLGFKNVINEGGYEDIIKR
jgi:phage shock protein E